LCPDLVGEERSFEPRNDEHARTGPTRYPSVALLPMAAMVEHVAALPLSRRISLPCSSSPGRSGRGPGGTAEIAERWGGPTTIVRARIPRTIPSNHVIAGDIMSPSNNDAAAAGDRRFHTRALTNRHGIRHMLLHRSIGCDAVEMAAIILPILWRNSNERL
jgi:hypothetical protein